MSVEDCCDLSSEIEDYKVKSEFLQKRKYSLDREIESQGRRLQNEIDAYQEEFDNQEDLWQNSKAAASSLDLGDLHIEEIVKSCRDVSRSVGSFSFGDRVEVYQNAKAELMHRIGDVHKLIASLEDKMAGLVSGVQTQQNEHENLEIRAKEAESRLVDLGCDESQLDADIDADIKLKESKLVKLRSLCADVNAKSAKGNEIDDSISECKDATLAIVAECEETNERHTHQVAERTESHALKEKKRASVEKEISVRMVEVSDLKEALDQQIQENMTTSKQRDEVTSAMNSLLLQVETITAEVGTLTLENKDKEGKLHECRNNNQMQRVRIEQQSLHHQSQEAPHLQADVEKLQASLNEVSASIQSIRELLETSPESVRPGLNAEIDELLEKISASTARKTALLQSMEVRKKELEKELSPLDTALTEANAALDVASTEWEGISAEHAVLSEELLKFKASLTPSQTQDSTMDTEGITADETMPDLGDSMATLTALRDTLQQSHHEVTTGKGDIVEEISTLVNEIADLGAKIRMQQELRSTKYKEQELSKSLSEARKSIMNAQKQKLEDLQKMLQRKDTEFQDAFCSAEKEFKRIEAEVQAVVQSLIIVAKDVDAERSASREALGVATQRLAQAQIPAANESSKGADGRQTTQASGIGESASSRRVAADTRPRTVAAVPSTSPSRGKTIGKSTKKPASKVTRGKPIAKPAAVSSKPVRSTLAQRTASPASQLRKRQLQQGPSAKLKTNSSSAKSSAPIPASRSSIANASLSQSQDGWGDACMPMFSNSQESLSHIVPRSADPLAQNTDARPMASKKYGSSNAGRSEKRSSLGRIDPNRQASHAQSSAAPRKATNQDTEGSSGQRKKKRVSDGL